MKVLWTFALIAMMGCATGPRVLARQGTACDMDFGRRDTVVYPRGRQMECERVLKQLADLEVRRQQEGLSRSQMCQAIVVLYEDPDARAVRAASRLPGMLEQLREGCP